ncbi:alpha/beta fold hydrolase [Pseudomonas sp. N040]|uniref:alpha/beta fold hydrolase n=1 Tax=Pseudomonas sp. N040 TaxID=2785325 RepID=UPI0018A30A73|nr:alpha/beta fold hydrolase [Pseudomonas sp. N040]MBF7730564.1 alpha/beta fold hydrolase [Pseudomonas sp. N040]MBW7014208.1 alpha/beta fold hydrolase [Pseudomonas sp. N040]
MTTKKNPPSTTRSPAKRRASKRAEPSAISDNAAELIQAASNNTLAASPLIGLSARDVGAAAGAMVDAVIRTPGEAKRHLGNLGREVRSVLKGESSLAPNPKDRRFADPAWQGNFVLKGLLQTYLATQRELDRFIEAADISPVKKGRAHFLSSIVVDALAPSNWPLANPTALRKALDTGGANYKQGIRNLIADIRHNNGLPSQVDSEPFKVGVNVATTPGDVVFRNEMFELLHFRPTTAKVHQRPLVMSPPQINKYYMIDLAPEKSLIKWATDSGIQFFCISWRNPKSEHRDWGLADYVRCLDQAVDVAREITGSPDVNMWGSCSGGLTLAAYLAWLAGRGEQKKVTNTTWAVCVLNTKITVDETTIGLFTTPKSMAKAKAASRKKGRITGAELARMFAWMRPNDLIWNYWVNNYLLGNKPPAFDILAWNNDTTHLPAKLHADYLDLVERNPYANPGAMEIDGVPIDMRKVKVGAYVIGGTTDHITPWHGCYGSARLLGPDTTFVLANAGHLQCFVNPPGNPKSFYFMAPAKARDANAWLKSAGTQVSGSWWPHWREWIQQRSGIEVDAPAKTGSAKYPSLCPAPGTYVLEK